MPSGPKKRRAQKKKAAASGEKNVNEAPITASSRENSPVMQTESTDGVTVVFDEPTVVLPKRTVLPEKMLASQVLYSKRKDIEEGTKEPLETSQADKIDVVVESSVVAAPCVIEMDSQDEDGGSIMSTDVCEGKKTKETSPVDETDAVATDDAAALSVTMDNTVKSLTTQPCDLDLIAVECSNAENAVLTNASFVEDQRTLEHKEDNAVEESQDLVTPKNVVVENQETAAQGQKLEEADQVDEVEVAAKDQEAAISEDVNNIEKNTLEAAAENQVSAALNDVDAPAKTEEAVLINEVEAAKPAVDIVNETRDVVSTEPVTPEVGKQLNEIKEMVEDVLSRLNAIDALLHRN